MGTVTRGSETRLIPTHLSQKSLRAQNGRNEGFRRAYLHTGLSLKTPKPLSSWCDL